MNKIDIVVPIYKEAEVIEEFHSKLISVILNFDYRIIYCMDQSSDETEIKLKEIAQNDSRTIVLIFANRCGHQTAIFAGLENCRTDSIVLSMDGDLQHPPELIPNLYQKISSGAFDICQTVRVQSVDPRWYVRKLSKFYYQLLSKLSGVELRSGLTDFRAISPKVRKIIVDGMRVHNPFIRAFVETLQLPKTYVTYTPAKRQRGESKFSLVRLLEFGITGIVSFSTAPLRLLAIAGLLISFICFLSLSVLFVFKVSGLILVSGWTSLAILILFGIGIQIFSIGIVGIYIADINQRSSGRQIYLVKEQLNSLI